MSIAYAQPQTYDRCKAIVVTVSVCSVSMTMDHGDITKYKVGLYRPFHT